MTSFAEVISKVLEKDWRAVTEASLSRLYAHAQDGNFAIVSGWLSSQPQAENEKADAAIRQEIRNMGLGYIELEGHWEENEPEPSYFVHGMSKAQAVSILQTFRQEAVIYAGPETDGRVFLLWSSGGEDDLGEFHPGKIAQAFSSWKGRTFVFESLPSSWAGAVGASKKLGRIHRRR